MLRNINTVRWARLTMRKCLARLRGDLWDVAKCRLVDGGWNACPRRAGKSLGWPAPPTCRTSYTREGGVVPDGASVRVLLADTD